MNQLDFNGRQRVQRDHPVARQGTGDQQRVRELRQAGGRATASFDPAAPEHIPH